MNAPAIVATAPRDALRAFLLQHRNRDGGWGYFPSKASRIEPTCWALLALSRASERPIELDVLLRWPRRGGWFIDVAGAPLNYAFNALAAITALTHRDGGSDALAVARALLEVRGVRLGQGTAIRQDNSLQAWPWIDPTFSWVEPTSLCLLLVKKLRNRLPAAVATERIEIGERMLRDRACGAGGWNYGGSNVYGQELFPYVPTTALGLLAMQDHPTDPIVARALAWLTKEAASESSALALAFALIAFRACRAEAPAIEPALAAIAATTINRTNLLGAATGLYALTRSPIGEAAFAL